jgi:peptide-methionine (S)-S-oxide reductase
MHRFAISLAVSLGFISRGADDGDRRPESVTTAAVTVVAADTSIFAGGCFWCMEPPNGKIDGVLSTTSGCTSGAVANPTYDRVSAGGTGHTEAVRVVFDPARVSHDRLLGGVPAQHRSVRPRPAILRSPESVPKRHSSAHAAAEGGAEASLRTVAARFSEPVVTEIVPATTFCVAEDHHQGCYTENPIRYRFHRSSCGGDERLEEIRGAEAGS